MNGVDFRPEIYTLDFRGTPRAKWIPKSFGNLVPIVTPESGGIALPGNTTNNINNISGGDGSLNDILPVSIVFFSNGGSQAGRYLASSEVIPWSFIVDSLWISEPNSFGAAYLSWNIFLTDTFYNGVAGDIPVAPLIQVSVNKMDGVPLDLQSPIGPYFGADLSNTRLPQNARPLAVCWEGLNKRLGVGIKYTGGPGPNSYLAFNFILKRI